MISSSISPNAKFWMVRSDGGLYLDHFLTQGTVEIGWGVGPINQIDTGDDIRKRCAAAYPGDSNGWHQIRRFVQQAAIGDSVVTYDGKSRIYHIGVIRSDASHIADVYGIGKFSGYSRKVDWNQKVSRDLLSADARNRLGGQLTCFGLPASTAQELNQLCYQGSQTDELLPDSSNEDVEYILDTGDVLKDYIAKSDEFVEDAIAKLGPYQLQDLVAGILRAMGFHTKVSPPGPDGGVDIQASPDGLGLSDPRIFVQVKHKKGAVGAPDVHSFLGGRSSNDRCLYVSTGGFTKDANSVAMHVQIPLTLIGMTELRGLLINHYESLDPETRALVPLKKVYWPVAE